MEEQQIFNAKTKVISGYDGYINFIPIVLHIEDKTVYFTAGAYASDVSRYELMLSNGTVYDFDSKSITLDITENDELSMIAVGYDSNNNIVIESEQTYLKYYATLPDRLTSVYTSREATVLGHWTTTGRFHLSSEKRESYVKMNEHT